MNQIIAVNHARKSFDGRVALDDVTLAFLPSAKIGAAGPNGTGKSTLPRMMAGRAALTCLASTRGLRWAPLDPRSGVIQLVTYDGEHLGHVRRDSACATG